MADDASWWTIEGKTTRERIRNGLPQLVVLAVVTWVAALGIYRVVASAIDPITAAAVLLLGALYFGGKLRGLLVGDDGAEKTNDEQQP